MPIIDKVVTRLNAKFCPECLEENAGAMASKFAPGQGLQIAFVFSEEPQLRDMLQAYVDTMPAAISEAYRATLYQALTSNPPTPVVFTYEPAYDFEVRVTQTPNTRLTPGIITVALRGRYASDEHPLANAMAKARQSTARKSSKSSAKREGKRARRKPSKKNK